MPTTAEEAARVILRVVGWAHNLPSPYDGQYLVEVHPDALRADEWIACSADAAEARVFDTASEAIAYWHQQSTATPLRDDGEPNRPATAWTMSTVPALRARIGRLHFTMEMPTADLAYATWKAIEQDGRVGNISCWRTSSEDKATHYVTVVGEENDAAKVRRCRREALKRGGRETGLPEGMLDALRERRWQTAYAAAIAKGGKGDVRQEAHYGEGARLDRAGRMNLRVNRG